MAYMNTSFYVPSDGNLVPAYMHSSFYCKYSDDYDDSDGDGDGETLVKHSSNNNGSSSKEGEVLPTSDQEAQPDDTHDQVKATICHAGLVEIEVELFSARLNTVNNPASFSKYSAAELVVHVVKQGEDVDEPKKAGRLVPGTRGDISANETSERVQSTRQKGRGRRGPSARTAPYTWVRHRTTDKDLARLEYSRKMYSTV